MRPAFILLAFILSLAPLPAAAQEGLSRTKQDAELMNYQLSMDKLRKLNGNNFDVLYDKAQLAANKEAVSLLERYAKGGRHPDLKVFAARALPAAREHLRMARDLRR